MWLAEGCPHSPKSYVISDIISWARRHKWNGGRMSHDESDVDMDAESDNLERYRGAKADLAELDLAEREGRLVEPDKIRAAFVEALGCFRSAAETIDRQYGPDAFLVIDEAYQRAFRVAMEMVSDSGGGSEHGESATDRGRVSGAAAEEAADDD